MYTLLGLLERPSSRSFGMIPLIVQKTDDVPPEICGLSEASSFRGFKSLNEAQCHMRRQGLNLEFPITTFATKPEGMVAAWIGAKFLDECKVQEVPAPGVPTSAIGLQKVKGDPSGKVWTGPAKEIYSRMESWLKEAAILSCAQRSAEIFQLMQWCLPLHDETLAMEWYTTPETSRPHKLNWQLNYLKNRGKDAETLQHTHEQIVRRLLAKA